MSQIRRPDDEPFLLIRTLAAECGTGAVHRPHAHPWGQLIYSASGVMTVWTEAGSWVAPPQRAVWVPPGVAHATRFSGACSLRTLYVRPDAPGERPEGCVVIDVSPLLREMILRAVEIGMLDEREPAHAALSRLILEEFRRRQVTPLDLPAPVSAAAVRAAGLVTDGSFAQATADELARAVGLSVRTLERRFLEETGLSFGRWRRQARLQQALRDLALGRPIKTVAADAGYAGASAFTSAFREAFGVTPARYFASGAP
jgi:AraC-like DNA-binding protein